MEFRFRMSEEGHVGIFAVTPFNEIPIAIFEDWDNYKRFLDAMQGFYEKNHTEIPEVFKKAFGDKPN